MRKAVITEISFSDFYHAKRNGSPKIIFPVEFLNLKLKLWVLRSALNFQSCTLLVIILLTIRDKSNFDNNTAFNSCACNIRT